MATTTNNTTPTGPPESVQDMLSSMGIPDPRFTTSNSTYTAASAPPGAITLDPLASSGSTRQTASSGLGTEPASSLDPTPTRSASETTESPAVPQASKGLDTGSAAGIAVGATLGAVALILGLTWFWWKRRKTRNTNGRREHDGEPAAERVEILRSKAEKDGVERYEAPNTGRTAEADGTARAELDGRSRPAELEGEQRCRQSQ